MALIANACTMQQCKERRLANNCRRIAVAGYTEFINARAVRYVATNYEYLRKMLRKWVRPDDYEDCFSDIVYTAVHKAFETYVDTEGTEFTTHAMNYLRQYARKWNEVKRLDNDRFKSLNQLEKSDGEDKSIKTLAVDDAQDSLALDDEDSVLYLLDGLERIPRMVVYLHVGHEWTFDEIATQLGKSNCTVRVMYSEAMAKLREKSKRLSREVEAA